MDTLTYHLRRQWTWLDEVRLSDGYNSFEAPLWLRVALDAVTASEHRAIVLVMPQEPSAARWTATISALELFRIGFDERVARHCEGEPQIGARVVIQPENRFYFYQGKTESGLTILRCADGNQMSMRLSPLRIRSQPTGGSAGTLRSLHRRPPSHLMAELVGCDPMGNHEILGEGVVLIDSRSECKEFTSCAAVTKAEKSGILRNFDTHGHLVTVFRTALDFIDSAPTEQRTVIVNGGCRLDSLSQLHKLLQHRLVVFSSADELDKVKRLEGHADFWFLDDDPWLAASEDEASVKVRNIAERQWTPKLVTNPAVEAAAGKLGKFCRLLADVDQSPAQSLAGPAWGLLLELAGRTRGFSENQRRAFHLQLQQFEKATSKLVQWLTPEMEGALKEATTLMSSVCETQIGSTNSKGTALHELVTKESRLALVTRNENEARSVRARFANLSVYTQSDVPLKGTFDTIVVCGWLGARRMVQLLSSGAARRVVLVGYEFEVAWLKSLVMRWQRRAGIVGAPGEIKLEIVDAPESIENWPTVAAPPTIDWPTRVTPPVATDTSEQITDAWAGVDIWDFEYRVKNRRKDVSTRVGQEPCKTEQVPTRYVSFIGTAYAFFTTDRKVPAVTKLPGASYEGIAWKLVEELDAGDLIAFPRHSGSDVVGEAADRMLKGRADRLRMLANQYTDQLRVRARNGLTPEDFLAKAKPFGFKRSLTTVRDWFAGNRVIGPNSDDDILIIQKVVGGTEWATQCIEARHELHCAHDAALSSIRQALLKQLGYHLDEIETCGCDIDLGELGSVTVQCIESIGDKVEMQPRSKTNRLLGID